MTRFVPQLIKLLVFLLVTAAFTYVLGATISNQSYGDATSYKAEFTDVTGLNEGDDVRIAGVRVGGIESIALRKRSDGRRSSVADVTFTVQKSRPLPTSATATLRYRNLVGQRYLDIERGAGDTGKTMRGGDTIPLSRTKPAVDLTVLFQGFQPLTQGLDAGTLNQLSLEIVKTLQGEAGSLQTLLANLADLTNTLADKDQVIGDVIDNLSSVLTAVGQRDTELSQLIIQLKNFVSGLAGDRKTIGNAIDGINDLATSTAGLLTQVRKPLRDDVVQLNGLLGNLNRNSDTTKYVLQQLPPTLAGLIRTGSYGSWFNFYLCAVRGQVSLGSLKIPVPATNIGTGSRCG
ncbi:phospholipid/cholesterol/gamma-HCH transport system substrate-binding protein [Jatrophihabitans endophyticus]|uniref:Phospholipid/cholesterol/gamma-HCH transport system substrate-binding protein n=1 Tax=Jatrophihabitans endophyticus TaxID=1206085 RepID=A0A1M5GR40_9ACTN|nr:MCE family protein [Jatrophihabitans endophyticus]SHG05942.1 phospholipid/cholesterol/gamma-HCH transport system substrate-binding protein [Jatrophihabitans endophyticus]